MLLDTHNPYKPSIIDWPELDPEARDRLVGLPIWDIAVQTEGKARLRVLSYAETVTDPLLRQAIELDGFEEGRHKEVLSNLVEAYGIRLAAGTRISPSARSRMGLHGNRLQRVHRQLLRLWLVRGGQALGLFPTGAGRHVRAGHAGGRPPHPVLRQLGGLAPASVATVAAPDRSRSRSFAVWAFLIWERIGIARGVGGGDRAGADGAGRPGQQLHRDRQQVGRRGRSFPRRH